MISPSNDLYPFWVAFFKNQIVGTERRKSLGLGPLIKIIGRERVSVNDFFPVNDFFVASNG